MARTSKKPAEGAQPNPGDEVIDLSTALRDPEYPDCVLMTKDGEPDASVNENSVDTMLELGWNVKFPG